MVTAVLVLAGMLFAVVLYLVGVRRRGRHKIVPERQNGLLQDEAQRTPQREPSLQTQAPEEIQPDTEVEAHSKGHATQVVTGANTEELEEGAEGSKPKTTIKNAGTAAEELVSSSAGANSPRKGVASQEHKGMSPEKRGGRSRAGSRESEDVETNERLPRTAKPEIVCWKREREWVLAVEIPEGHQTVSVFQDSILLSEEPSEKGCWRLATLGGEVVISAVQNEHPSQFKIVVGTDDHLVFKLSGVNQNRGRRVKRATCGSYLVVVPADWERDEELSGPAPAKPEGVCLQSYRAHFFNLGADQK